MENWKEQFQAIEACIVVSEGLNDLATEKFENVQCGCRPSFAGEKICKDNRCINYAIQTECIRCDSGCCNSRIRNREYANLAVKETPGKGHGLFAAEDLRKQQFLREYVGELISPEEFDRRSSDKKNPSEHQYIMQLKKGVYLDASRKGSISRFINHSCEPNCFVEIWTVQGHLRVGIFAMCNISAGTELTFDYKWRRSSRPPTRCFCGTEYCRGYLEILSEEELESLKVRKGQWRIGGELLSAQLKRNRSSITSMSATGGLNMGLVAAGNTSAHSSSAALSQDSPANTGNRSPGLYEGIEETKDLSRESSKAELIADAARASPSTATSTATSNNSNAVEVLENDIYDSRRRLVPSKLIGKRVKVWWEGNLAFLEADVESYNPKTNKYLCKYEVDGSVSEEDFGPSVGSKVPAGAGAGTGEQSAGAEARSSVAGLSGNNGVQWKWLDETAEEIVIKKKINTSEDLLKDYEVVSSASDSATALHTSSQKAADTSFTAFTALNVTDRCVETLAPGVARFIADMYRPDTDLAQTATFTSVPNYSPWQNLQQICQLNFSVRATLSGPSGASVGDQVVMYGKTEQLATIRELLRAAEKVLQQGGNSEDKHLRKTLLNRQGVLLTKDWRFKPEKATEKASTEQTRRSATFQAYFTEKLKSLPDLSCVNCLPFEFLPSGIGADSGTEVAENVRKSLFSNMQGLTARLGFTTQASMNAFMLLVRFLRFPLGNARENTAVLAAIALIVAKLNGDFRHKMTKSIVKSAYCQVFNRDEGDITDESVLPYVEAALTKERLVFARLQSDVFSADVVPSLQAFVRAGLWADKWCLENDTVISDSSAMDVIIAEVSANQKDKHKDREAEKLKRKKIATFEYESNIRNVVRRSVLNNGELLAQELVYTFTTSPQEGTHLAGTNNHLGNGNSNTACAMVLCCLPVELLQLGSLVFVSLLSASLPSGQEHRRLLSEINAFTAALLATARTIGCSETLLQWTLEVVSEACAELLPRLECLSCFAELVDVYPPQEHLQRLRDVARDGLARSKQADSQQSSQARAPPLPSTPSAPAAPARPSTPPRAQYTSSSATSSRRDGKSALFDSDVPFKARLPWLSSEDSLQDSALDVSSAVRLSDFQDGRYVADRLSNGVGSDSLVPIAKDVFFGFASLETDSAKFLPPLTCCTNSGNNNNNNNHSYSGGEVDVGLMTLRAWPSHSQISKELKRAAVDDVHQLGLLPGPLAELTTLQHLHYLHHTAADASPELLTSGECPYFVAPVGIMNLSAHGLNANNAFRGTVLGVEQALSDQDEDANGGNSVSLKHNDPSQRDSFRTLSSITADRKASTSRAAEVFVPSVEFDLQFLAFPAVHISLSSILGFITSTTSPRWDLTKAGLESTPSVAHVAKVLQVNNGHLLVPALAVELCKDLLCAVAHMVACGVYLKWLNAEHIYITSAGRLQVGGLSGASYASFSSSSFKALNSSGANGTPNGTHSGAAEGAAGAEEEGLSIAVLSEQLSALRSQHSNNRNGNGNSATTTVDKTHRVKARKFKVTSYADEDEEESNNNTERLRRVAKKLALPRSALYTVAPEVILGGAASPESTVYSAAAVCAQILTGRALVKNASSEDKQVQYVYKVLGTPKPMGFTEFDSLPLAALYGRHIQEGNSDSADSRSRAFRVFKEQCSAPLLQCYSFTHPLPQPAPAGGHNGTQSQRAASDTGAAVLVSLADVQKVLSQSDTDHGGVVDLIRVSMQLVPQRRLPAELLLQFALFRAPAGALGASLAACNSGHKVRPELQSQKLRVSRAGASPLQLQTTALSNKSRLSCMEELVTSLRAVQRVKIPLAVQKKDIYYHPLGENDLLKLTQMDALLFRLEREKYRESAKNPVYEERRDHKTRDVSPGNYSSAPAPPPAPVPVPRVDSYEAYSYGAHNTAGLGGYNYGMNYGMASQQYGYGAPIMPPRPPVQPAYPADNYQNYGYQGSMNYSGGYNYGHPSGRIEPAYALPSAPLHSAYPAPPPPAMPIVGAPYPRQGLSDSAVKRGFYPSDVPSSDQDSKKQRASPY